tara:strand:+ start:405 stop:725 length:321 start_codon:yes stop_codon:yes gene_type:complete
MAQVSDVVLDNQGFASFRTELNNIIEALNSGHIGSSTPASAVAGTIWVDNGTSNTIKIKVNDGTDNLELFSIDTSTNAITLPSGVAVTGTITETDPNALPLAIALG